MAHPSLPFRTRRTQAGTSSLGDARTAERPARRRVGEPGRLRAARSTELLVSDDDRRDAPRRRVIEPRRSGV